MDMKDSSTNTDSSLTEKKSTTTTTEEISTIPEGAIDITEEKNGGALKIILKDGQGDARPTAGDTCSVHYVGTLLDGTKFDSSRDRAEPFQFRVGRSEVIKGWDLVVATMKKGELCKIILKPEYGYGVMGSEPRIPPNATLIFEIELISWEGEDISPDKDKTILRSLLQPGPKFDVPNEGSKIDAHVVGFYNGRQFMDKDVQFFMGECTEVGLPEGVDKAIKKFNKGERSLIHFKSPWSYGSEGNSQFGIPPNADVDLEIYLKDFEKAKQSWEFEDDEKLEQCEKWKQKGSEFFQQGKHQLAIAKYDCIVDFLQGETSWDGEKKQKRDNLLTATYNNLSMVYLKKNETVEAIKQCEKVLEIDAKNVKALYRWAQAHQNQNDFEDAIRGYERVLEVEPGNKAAQANISQCRNRLGEERKREKAIFANMFEKLAKSDDKASTSEAGTQNGVKNDTKQGDPMNVDEAGHSDQMKA